MPPERRLAAILSADVAGYSRLMAEDEQGTIQTITAYREAIGRSAASHRFPGELETLRSTLICPACQHENRRVQLLRRVH